MKNISSTREENLKNTVREIETAFGKGSIMIFNDATFNEVQVTSSGSILLDQALGIRGFPHGRIIEIYGPESTGKTTLALMALAQAQKTNQKVAFIDAEHALDAQYCQKLGINLDEFLLSQPDSGEQALEILEMLIKSQAVAMVVVDSVAALVPEIELNGEITDQVMGAQARLMSKALRRLSPVIAKNNCSVIFINQVRQKIGVVYGSAEVTPGGKALKFYSSIRLDVRKGEQIIVNQEVVGHKIKVKVVKNKLAPPYKIAIVDFYFHSGISVVSEMIDLAVEKKIISKSGTWYSYEDIKLGQGKENVRQYLENNSSVLEKIKLAI
ncbi:recombinase RecA [Spiroplasma platyhelix]|uniref:Protein RecA n=1 Tax=Spiroplasma platyhelix PALS-1 TaxID=1276218 RepID=A0A846U4C5_9MOLU|nr:recombinase RecA [Spiroplasma platyhelix]MBE4703934.1 Protein RecA [Spiroplasma platyhelix PALS-1]NKE38307.1 recombinase RecA [Spiroplasma platyhelix PALS-1]UJB29192.1 recombinase A [Spiroplasma platyhelix PALS-1]